MTARMLDRLLRKVIAGALPLVLVDGCATVPAAQENSEVVAAGCAGDVAADAGVAPCQPVHESTLRCGDSRVLALHHARWPARVLVAVSEEEFARLARTFPHEIAVAACRALCVAPPGTPAVEGTSSRRMPDGTAVSVRSTLVGCDLQRLAGGEPALSCRVQQRPDVGCFEVGRRPAGLHESAVPVSSLGAHLAQMARLEAASVAAFTVLARELRAHGAPARLVAAARRSAREEVRHARMVSALARRAGGDVQRAAVVRGEVRPLEEIARENAVEGCVRETYGAAIAHWQAQHAADPQVRGVMQKIAIDETRHAALAWQVKRWAEPRLSLSARSRVQAAMRSMAAEIQAQTEEPLPEIVAHLGHPTLASSRMLLGQLAQQLWDAETPRAHA